MSNYRPIKWPRHVYMSADPDSWVLIQSEDERPDGAKDFWYEFPDYRGPGWEKYHTETPKASEKESLIAYLTEHNVQFDKESSVRVLRDLKRQLDVYLADQTNGVE